MISKELLSLVLGEDIIDIYKLGSNPNLTINELPYKIYGLGDLQIINLDTLGRLCKKWCLEQDEHSQIITSYVCDMKIKNKLKRIGFADFHSLDMRFTADSELGAIIKATEWVAKEKDLL